MAQVNSQYMMSIVIMNSRESIRGLQKSYRSLRGYLRGLFDLITTKRDIERGLFMMVKNIVSHQSQMLRDELHRSVREASLDQ